MLIELLNIDNQQNEIIFDEHVHQQKTFTYENIKKFDTTGHFVMTVSSTNMEETEEVKEEKGVILSLE